MKRMTLKAGCALTLAVAGILAAGLSIADKPSSAGGGKNKQKNSQDNGKGNHRDGDDRSERSSRDQSGSNRDYFDDRRRTVVHTYYTEEFRRGHCPPGLAKKRNGCMPPGQAKKWHVGRPLPPEVVYYSVPPPLVIQLGQPSGHRYVRVASDILLIAIGTGMVVAGIQDLGRM